MLLYRVFRHLRSAKPGEPGHPMYLHQPQQGASRWDAPHLYNAWYLSRNAECAVGETLGDHKVWRKTTFNVSPPARARLALGTYQVPDDIALLDLDNASNLFERQIRPTEVTSRNRSATQGLAEQIFSETRSSGSRKWAGISWWSVRWPQWNPVCLWQAAGEPPPHILVKVENLSLTHPAVIDAAQTLSKLIV